MIEVNIKAQQEILNENEYFLISKKEYNKLIEKIEDLEDLLALKDSELDPDNQEEFTIDEVARECGIDMNQIRANRNK